MCFGLLKTCKILLNVMSIYLFVYYFSKLLLLDFRCWLFSVLHVYLHGVDYSVHNL